MQDDSDLVTPGQRALWTFLIGTLAGPFFAALIVAAIVVVSVLLKLGPESLKNLGPGQLGPTVAQYALTTYVWGAIPAGIAGALCAAWLSLRGALPWLVAAIASAMAATIAAVASGGMLALHVTPIAAIAATAGCVVWAMLRRAGIVPSSAN
jgi:hypothetical protein